LRWLLEIWTAAVHAQQQGIDIRAVTVWALLGSYDWNCLLSECRGYYEPGPFDVRSGVPRPTAVAALMRELAGGIRPSHPVLKGQGWWRRSERLTFPPVATRVAVASLQTEHPAWGGGTVPPILITGATGTLGSAFARMCQRRNLAFVLLTRGEMDIAVRTSVEQALARHRPWAIINASGYVNVDNAETDVDRCFRENTLGPSILVEVCARDGARLLTFSSDLVFDGQQQRPYLESDRVSPLNAYGRSKAQAEQEVLAAQCGALVVRTSAFFGPWDPYNFITVGLKALAEGRPFAAANDIVVSPTYVPDLVHACLDLLIDGAEGIWHLTNGQSVAWSELLMKAAGKAGIDTGTLDPRPSGQLGYLAPRPLYSALASERASFLPTLDDALDRYLDSRQREIQEAVEAARSGKSASA
jgi:dTDP-4-dehydrorhamnose reductase